MKIEIHFPRRAARRVSAGIVLLAVSCLPTFAQPGPDNAPKRPQQPLDARRGDRLAFGGPQGWQPGRYAPLLERVLTEEQRISLREAMEAQRDKMRDLEEKLAMPARKCSKPASCRNSTKTPCARRRSKPAGWTPN
jgi:hypothetical protein